MINIASQSDREPGEKKPTRDGGEIVLSQHYTQPEKKKNRKAPIQVQAHSQTNTHPTSTQFQPSLITSSFNHYLGGKSPQFYGYHWNCLTVHLKPTSPLHPFQKPLKMLRYLRHSFALVCMLTNLSPLLSGFGTVSSIETVLEYQCLLFHVLLEHW